MRLKFALLSLQKGKSTFFLTYLLKVGRVLLNGAELFSCDAIVFQTNKLDDDDDHSMHSHIPGGIGFMTAAV